MSDYKRLTDKEYLNKPECFNCEHNYSNSIICERHCIDGNCFELRSELRHLAELEDKIENKTLIDSPCKIGDTVWCLIAQGKLGTIYTTGEAIPRKVNKIIFDSHGIEIYSERLNYYNNGNANDCNYYGYFGETVFLTKPEAEAKLKQIRKRNSNG